MKSPYPKISVVMPVYNREKYLRDAVNSILNQTFQDFEFIIIDDGSTDQTPQIIDEYKKNDQRIISFQQPQNCGVVNARNKGLEMARGEYLAVMDSDDISLPHRLETQYRFLETHPNIGVVGSNVTAINATGKVITNFINRVYLPQTPTVIRWSFCFTNNVINPVVMARTDILRAVSGYSVETKGLAEDYDLWTRVALHNNFYNIQEVLLLLRSHEFNISKTAIASY